MTIIFQLSIAMLFGLLFNRLAKKINLPNVTGYLVAGLLIGKFVFNVFDEQTLKSADVLVEVALGFIAFSIGGEFKISELKQIGSKAFIITLCESCLATLIVMLSLFVLGFDAPTALLLGAIAAATAPAATLMVVRQYKAKGPITKILLPAVALDDAVGLILFSICLGISKVLALGETLSVANLLLAPLAEIFFSFLLGMALGVVLSIALKIFKSQSNRLCVLICMVFLATSLSSILHLSSLLVCMSVGGMMANLSKDYISMLDINDKWTPPLFMLFFVISGAELDFSVLPSVGLLGVAYILTRSAGKYFGARLGATIIKADINIRRYLGVALLPQAGVAIGMSQIVSMQLPEYAPQIRAVILSATLVYELIGPVLTKIVLTKAGEIEKK